MDNEIKGVGNSLNYKYRMHDPRLGRFFAIDPLTKKYPWYSPYQFSGNKVIAFIELEGLEEYDVKNENGTGVIGGPYNSQEDAQTSANNDPNKLVSIKRPPDKIDPFIQDAMKEMEKQKDIKNLVDDVVPIVNNNFSIGVSAGYNNEKDTKKGEVLSELLKMGYEVYEYKSKVNNPKSENVIKYVVYNNHTKTESEVPFTPTPFTVGGGKERQNIYVYAKLKSEKQFRWFKIDVQTESLGTGFTLDSRTVRVNDTTYSWQYRRGLQFNVPVAKFLKKLIKVDLDIEIKENYKPANE